MNEWKKVSGLKKILKAAYFGGTTLLVSLEGITLTFFGANREKIDRMLHRWGARFFNRIGAGLAVNNPANVDINAPGNKIVMANHSSHFDIPILIHALQGSMRMLAKKELSRIPVFGYACKRCEMMFIDRKNKAEAIKDLEDVKAKLKSGIVMCIFPEGTRSNDGRILPLKKGAIRLAIETGATIIPVGIVGANKALPARSFDLHEDGEIQVNIGPTIDTKDYDLSHRDELSDKVREELSRLTGQSFL